MNREKPKPEIPTIAEADHGLSLSSSGWELWPHDAPEVRCRLKGSKSPGKVGDTEGEIPVGTVLVNGKRALMNQQREGSRRVGLLESAA